MARPKYGIGGFHPRCLQPLACIQAFSFFLGIFAFVVGILPMYTVSQLTSIEKHFGLTSRMSGTIVASSEIGFIATSLLTGHFLSPSHRPRIIASCALLTSLACFFMTTPFFQHLNSDKISSSNNGSNTEGTMALCGARNCPDGAGGREEELNTFAYRLFIFCTIATGIGSTSFYTLGVSYVDDNADSKLSPKYIG